MAIKALLINGPNLNLLGQREPKVYGTETLAEIVDRVTQHAQTLGVELSAFQSNSEGDIIERIHQSLSQSIDCILLNPGAFTHTSIALRDALLSVNTSVIEIHLSNIFARETFRQRSYISDIARAVITGLGAEGYMAAVNFVAKEFVKE